MRELRILLVTVLSAALLVTMLAVPVGAASKGKLAIVQGWTNQKVDVCINGREVASAMRFSKVVYRKLSPGPKLIKVYKADRRTCKGTLLAKRWKVLAAGDDKTMVIGKWKKPKQLLVFDNDPPPGAPSFPAATHLVMRHAADYGAVRFRQWIDALPDDPVAPGGTAAVIDWKRGDEAWRAHPIGVGGSFQYALTWVSEEIPFAPGTIEVAGPKLTQLGDHARYEFIFIGRGDKTRLLVLRRG